MSRRLPEKLPSPLLLDADGSTTRMQRLAILATMLIGLWVALQLFAAVLLPFVAAAGTAYFLDPPTSRLTRAGMGRGAASLLMIVALVALGLLFALLLYPLILAQIGILISRLPAYVGSIRSFATDVIAHLQERLGPEFVDEKLRDLVAGQAGTMLAVLVTAISRVIGGSFALFNVLTLLLVTPVVAFYLLRDWPSLVARIDGWLPRRYAGVLIVLGVFIAGQILEGYIIYPRFLGDRVELHAVWVIFALFAGGAAFGFVGVLMAVPVAAVIGVLCRFWLGRYLESPLYLEPPARREREP